jgi:hypothetical protein
MNPIPTAQSLFATLLFAGLAALAPTLPAEAGGACSLREALRSANTNTAVGEDIIVLGTGPAQMGWLISFTQEVQFYVATATFHAVVCCSAGSGSDCCSGGGASARRTDGRGLPGRLWLRSRL